jgi:hypothetical protein
VSIEVVHDQSDFDRIWIAFVQHAFDKMSPLFSGSPLSHFNVPLTSQRFHFDEDLGDPTSNVFIINNLPESGRGWNWWMNFFD